MWIGRFMVLGFLAMLLVPDQILFASKNLGFIAEHRWIFLAVTVACVALASLRRMRSRLRRRPAAAWANVASRSSAHLPLKLMDRVDREFLPAALELSETPPSPINIAGIWFICLGFGAALAWAYFGQLDIYAEAQGRVQPIGLSKSVQSLDVGKVVAIAVENGSRVTAGDLMIELDSRETWTERELRRRDFLSAGAEAARRNSAIAAARSGETQPPNVLYPAGTSAEIQAREDAVLAADIAQLVLERAVTLAQRDERIATCERLKASMAEREKLIAIDKEHVEMRQMLTQSHTVSRAQVIETLQQYQTHVTAQADERGQLAESEAALTTLGRKLEEITAQFIADQSQKLADAERKADELKSEIVKADIKHERMRLTAPISGTVQQLAVTTVGQVVGSGQSLMTIVPFDAPIEIEALIQNQDIGFVEPGQKAVIKIEAFPFSRYGTVDGRVLRVSHDAVDEREAQALSDPKAALKPQPSNGVTEVSASQNLVFPATISLGKQALDIDGKQVPLTPGMAVTVEVLTGHRRALEYVLSPLREVAFNSAHER
jgi:hemolysin D